MLWRIAAYGGLGAGKGARVSDFVYSYQESLMEMVKSEQKPERDWAAMWRPGKECARPRKSSAKVWPA